MKSMFVSRMNSPTRRITQPSPLVSLGFVETPLSDLASACSHCTQTFSAVASKTFLRMNTTTVVSSLDSRFYWCNFCHFSTDNKEAIVDHVIKQHRFGCNWCSFQSFCRASVLRHSFQKHQQDMSVAVNISTLCSFVEDRCNACTEPTSSHGNADSQTSAFIPRDVHNTKLLKALVLAGPAEEQESEKEDTHRAVKPEEELKHIIEQNQIYNTDPVESSSSSESLGGSCGDGKQEDSGKELTHQNMLKSELGVKSAHQNKKQHMDRSTTQDSEDENLSPNRQCDGDQHDTTAGMNPNDKTDSLLEEHKMSTDKQCRKTDTIKSYLLEPVSRTLTKGQKFKGNKKAACYKETSLSLTDSGSTTPKKLKEVTLSNNAIGQASQQATENLSYIFKHYGKLLKQEAEENFDSRLCPAYFSNTDKESSHVVLNFPEVAEQLVCTYDGRVPVTKQTEGPSVTSCSEEQHMECLGDIPTEPSLTNRFSVKEGQAGQANLGTESSEVPLHDGQSDLVTRVQAAENIPMVKSSVTNVIKMKMTETIGSANNSGCFSSYLKENAKYSRKDCMTLYPEVPLDPTERSLGREISSAASASLDLDNSYLQPESRGLEKDSIAPADQCLEAVQSKSLPSLVSKKAARIQSNIKANPCPALIAQLLEAPSVERYDTNMTQRPRQIQERALLESEPKRSKLSQEYELFKKKMKDVELGLMRKQSSGIIIKPLNNQQNSVATSSECWKELVTDQLMAHHWTQTDGSERRMWNTPPKAGSLPELIPKRSPASRPQCPTTVHSKHVNSKASNLSRNPRRVDMDMISLDQVSTGRTYFEHSRNLGEVVKRLHRRNREAVSSLCKELSPGLKKRKVMQKK